MQDINKAVFINCVNEYCKLLFRKNLSSASKHQKYEAVAYTIKDIMMDHWMETHKRYEEQDVKTVYYLSMEFLVGRALGNMLINLGIYDVVKESLADMDIDLILLEEEEREPALGNGGLGRLAACFLDSLSTLGYAAYGCGIRYKYGMFEQKIEHGEQVEIPSDWLENGYPFEMKRLEYATTVKFGGYVKMIRDEYGRDVFVQEGYQAVQAVPYDIPVPGYHNDVVNTLRIWDAEAIQHFNLSSFDKGDYIKAVEEQNLASSICEVLYPNDNHYAGKELRLKQQYFFVSASIQRAVNKYMESHEDITKLYEKVCFQMNDTHPAVTVAELMRILLDDYYLSWDMAWEITKKTCAYTNHTIMSEALEKWPIDLFSRLLPRIYQIIEEINRRFMEVIRKTYPGDDSKIENMAILYNGQVRMAYLAVVGSFSVNGVAKLHTQILKSKVLHDFYLLMPEKFNNKTNGITQRRFLLHGNPELTEFISKRIGEGYEVELKQLEKLIPYADDVESQKEFMKVKRKNKKRLSDYIWEHNQIEIDVDSIFDVQIKRLHEYKRQLLNILHVMYQYQKLKQNPNEPFYKKTYIFGAKASAGYVRAKKIIQLINGVADVINHDTSIQNKMKVVFIENYKVSNAELLFSAADLSEQISTASKEASGTGNMKFMLNGAVTIGTMDGANVEIIEEVGREHAFIFGLTAQEVIRYETERNYDPREVLESDQELKGIVEQLLDGNFSNGDREVYRELYRSLTEPSGYEMADQYFILKDFRSYVEAQERATRMYTDQKEWARTAILNVAHSGKFSSDRTIREYANEIWGLDPVK